MIVKKKNPEWFPQENRFLKVGETIDITDPKALILAGDVVGVGTHGEELSAFELYSVVVSSEREEFEEYMKIKKQEALKVALEEDKKKLDAIQKELDAQKAVAAASVEVAPKVTEPTVTNVVEVVEKKKK